MRGGSFRRRPPDRGGTAAKDGSTHAPGPWRVSEESTTRLLWQTGSGRPCIRAEEKNQERKEGEVIGSKMEQPSPHTEGRWTKISTQQQKVRVFGFGKPAAQPRSWHRRTRGGGTCSQRQPVVLKVAGGRPRRSLSSSQSAQYQRPKASASVVAHAKLDVGEPNSVKG